MTPPSQERIRIVTEAPDRYVLRVDTGHATEYQVPADGRMALAVPSYRPSCSVYLFNVIKVRGGESPLRTWTITVSLGNKPLQKLSLERLRKLPTDLEGNRLLKISE